MEIRGFIDLVSVSSLTMCPNESYLAADHSFIKNGFKRIDERPSRKRPQA